jgi:hypothetical protein
MKICKNNFDIVVYAVTTCDHCTFGRNSKDCCWVDIFKKYSFNCGGVVTQSTSDIFKL